MLGTWPGRLAPSQTCKAVCARPHASSASSPSAAGGMQESQDSKDEGEGEDEDGAEPATAPAARAAGATVKAAAEQREAPPPKAKGEDPAAGGSLTEKEGRNTGAWLGHPSTTPMVCLSIFSRSVGSSRDGGGAHDVCLWV